MIRVVPFSRAHVTAARELAMARFRVQRGACPALPEHDSPVMGDGLPAAAAIENGRLVGFLTAVEVGSLRGHRSAYSPEWMHGLAPGYEDTFGDLYGAVAGQRHDIGIESHVVTTFAYDDKLLRSMQWQGFGAIVADGVRSLDVPDRISSAVAVRRAGVDDAEGLATLGRGLVDHLASSPVLLRFPCRSVTGATCWPTRRTFC